MPQSTKTYDLETRTSRFGVDIIVFCKKLPLDTISRPVISQIIKSATSIGANYREANNASSRKDFIHKIHICRKEIQETRHWLQMVAACYPAQVEQIAELERECTEFALIFNKISFSLREP